MKRDIIKQEPFLKVLRFGVCPKCLQSGVSDLCTNQGRTIHYHCTNPECTEYGKDVSMSAEVFDLLCYLEDHQPLASEIEELV
ncbi:hypothetical protein [Acutalibacter sp. 1XD8-33]|uniref:hypothetical protein n=1 Tax=Acutalibacter sp. 1XD8-33 TaxID=2320081 RepID=UPI0011C350C4|nr:hypothetical protein [Acutalibacter sp. 1XD8-33]